MVRSVKTSPFMNALRNKDMLDLRQRLMKIFNSIPHLAMLCVSFLGIVIQSAIIVFHLKVIEIATYYRFLQFLKHVMIINVILHVYCDMKRLQILIDKLREIYKIESVLKKGCTGFIRLESMVLFNLIIPLP